MVELITKWARQVVPSVVATLIAAAIISVYNHAFSEQVPMTRVPRLAPAAAALDPAAGLPPATRIEQAFAEERRAVEKGPATDSARKQGQVAAAEPAAPQPAAVVRGAPPAMLGQIRVKPAKPQPAPTQVTAVRAEPPAPMAPAIEVIEAPAQPAVVQPARSGVEPPRPAGEIPVTARMTEQTLAAPSALIDRGARFLAAIEAAGNAILPSIRN